MSNESDSDASIAGSSKANTSSATEDKSSSDSCFVSLPAKKAKRSARRQAFCQAWLEDSRFKSWLQEAQDKYKARCAVCCKNVRADRSELQRHADSLTHRENMNHKNEGLHPKRNFSNTVKKAEVMFCIDIIEHNRSLYSYTQFIKMLQRALPDSHIVKSTSLESTKISGIIKNVVNKAVILETKKTVQDKFFSVFIDETTDTCNTKTLCFLIRYMEKDRIHTYLLDSVRLSDAKAENLYTCFLHSLNKHNLSLSNMVGLCAENANGTEGAHNALTSRLLEDNPDMCVFPCICQSMHLVASLACKCLPSFVEEFLHAIYLYFAQSPKRLCHLEELKMFMHVEQLKILQPSGTRWLAAPDCVKRILKLWGPLYSAMAEAASEKESDLAKKIYDFMNCRFTKAYLEFLSYALDAIIHFEKLFRTSNIVIHCLLSECFKLLRILASNLIKPEYNGRCDVHETDVDNEKYLFPLETIYPGAACVSTLKEIENNNGDGDREKITEFYRNVKRFYQSAFKEIVKRMPFNEIFLSSLDFLHPAITLDFNRHRKDHLACILKKFKSKNLNEADVMDEWRALAFFFPGEEKGKFRALGVVQFWHHIGSIQSVPKGSYKFPNISKLARLCLSLPHSNADVERYFSTVTQVETRDTNGVNPETVAALTRIKLDLKNKNVHCYDYKVTDDMLNLFNDSIYNKEKIPEELLGILLPGETEGTDDTDNN